jgi:hypothetical protein
MQVKKQDVRGKNREMAFKIERLQNGTKALLLHFILPVGKAKRP